MIEIRDGLPDHVVGINVSGRVEAEDYRATLEPAIEQALQTHDRINALIVVDKDGAEYSSAAMWQDVKMGVKRPRTWNRVALVSDNKWTHRFMPMLSAAMPGKFKTFSPTEEQQALDWVSESLNAAND